jgi:hypothetical protein
MAHNSNDDSTKLLHSLAPDVGPPPPPKPPAAANDGTGGWSTVRSQLDSDVCNIDTIGAGELTTELFETEYRTRKPLIIRNLTRHLAWPANTRWMQPQLLELYGKRVVTADGTHRPYGARKMVQGKDLTLQEHVEGFATRHEQVARGEVDPAAEERTRYAFDRKFFRERAPVRTAAHACELVEIEGKESGAEEFNGIVQDMLADFATPPLFEQLGGNESTAEELGAQAHPYLYLGPADSGLWFHRHGEAWNGLVFGRKRWMLFPPTWKSPRLGIGDPDTKTPLGLRRWLKEYHPKLAGGALAPLECAQTAGDVVYVPANWIHATNNLNDCVGVAVDHPLMPTKTKPVHSPATLHIAITITCAAYGHHPDSPNAGADRGFPLRPRGVAERAVGATLSRSSGGRGVLGGRWRGAVARELGGGAGWRPPLRPASAGGWGSTSEHFMVRLGGGRGYRALQAPGRLQFRGIPPSPPSTSTNRRNKRLLTLPAPQTG